MPKRKIVKWTCGAPKCKIRFPRVTKDISSILDGVGVPGFQVLGSAWLGSAGRTGWAFLGLLNKPLGQAKLATFPGCSGSSDLQD